MPLEIVPYQLEHEPAVAAFNNRARAHHAPFGLSKTWRADWLPVGKGREAERQFFLALEGGEVRGGFTLRRQDFLLRGRIVPIANYQGPLSEGLWDRRFMMTGVQMLRAALRENALLYALGMGGATQPLPRLLSSAGWPMELVPFKFKVLRAGAFLREIRPPRSTPWRARVLDAAAASGIGPLLLHAEQWRRTKRRDLAAETCEVAADFGAWADNVWDAASPGLTAAAVRDARTQNLVFGDGNARNIILRCRRAGADIGWAVVRSTQMNGDQYFGDLRLGSLIDALAMPGEERGVVELAIQHLRGLASDLVVTNQLHPAWNRALADGGFFSSRSNFLFALSPSLAEALGGTNFSELGIHLNRADGDGPIHL